MYPIFSPFLGWWWHIKSLLSSSGLVNRGVWRVWAWRHAGGASDPFPLGLLSVWGVRKVSWRGGCVALLNWFVPYSQDDRVSLYRDGATERWPRTAASVSLAKIRGDFGVFLPDDKQNRMYAWLSRTDGRVRWTQSPSHVPPGFRTCSPT